MEANFKESWFFELQVEKLDASDMVEVKLCELVLFLSILKE